jgi:hypothetical protein
VKKVKTAETTPNQINWLVSEFEFGVKHLRINGGAVFLKNCDDLIPCNYSTDPSQAYPIIDRELIGTHAYRKESDMAWRAVSFDDSCKQYGPTLLVAAMRCYVAFKLGDEVEVPEGLV